MLPLFASKYLQALRHRRIGYPGRLAARRTRGRVHSGPFAGMQYAGLTPGMPHPGEEAAGTHLPKLLGIYERELAGAIETICARQPRLIIDIGAARGYYAVGLALRNPQARIIGFEMDPRGQTAIARLAAANGTQRQIDLRGRCERQHLAAALGDDPHPVVICDIEGYEYYLLDPQAVPALHRAAVLVEVHEMDAPGVTAALRQRFAPTHHIEHIWAERRTRRDFPWTTLGTLIAGKRSLETAISEQRLWRMSWLWMVPK